MTSDANLKAAISHWGPRFVSNGVLLSDFEEVTRPLERWTEWCAAWSARAGVHERLGRDALAQDLKLSAGEHLSRAAVYYHFAKFAFVVDLDQMRVAHAKAVECKTLAAPLLQPAGQRVTVPYQGGILAGLLRRPDGVAQPPVVIMVPGLDSAKEELEAYELPFLARGMATLLVDGPGQGEAEYDYPIRGDYEVAVGAVVDWVEQQGDSGLGAHRPVGREPRRVLRAACGCVREAYPRLRGSVGPVRPVGQLGPPASARAGGLPRAQPQRRG